MAFDFLRAMISLRQQPAKKEGGPAEFRRQPSPPILWDGSVDRQPSSSDTSNSSEHPYDAYTSCQLWSSPAVISFPAAIITALCTNVRRGRGYKARKGGEV